MTGWTNQFTSSVLVWVSLKESPRKGLGMGSLFGR